MPHEQLLSCGHQLLENLQRASTNSSNSTITKLLQSTPLNNQTQVNLIFSIFTPNFLIFQFFFYFLFCRLVLYLFQIFPSMAHDYGEICKEMQQFMQNLEYSSKSKGSGRLIYGRVSQIMRQHGYILLIYVLQRFDNMHLIHLIFPHYTLSECNNLH